MPIAEKQSAFLFTSHDQTHNAEPLQFADLERVYCRESCFFVSYFNNRKAAMCMQILNHVIFLLNLLRTLLNHFF